MYTYSISAYFVYYILDNFAAQQKTTDFFLANISIDHTNILRCCYQESIFKMKI